MPMTNNGMNKLVEELGELQQVIGKLLAYPDHINKHNHPDGGKPLADRFIDEAGDVIAAIRFVAEKLGVDMYAIHRRAAGKNEIFRQWDKEAF